MIGHAHHHHHVVGFFLGEDVARRVPPVEIALVFVTQEAGAALVLADDGDLRRVGKRVFQAVGEPVGHGVAHHQDRGGGNDRLGFRIRLARGRRPRIIGLRRRLLALERALEGPTAAAAEQLLKEVAAPSTLRLGRARNHGAAERGHDGRGGKPTRKLAFSGHSGAQQMIGLWANCRQKNVNSKVAVVVTLTTARRDAPRVACRG